MQDADVTFDPTYYPTEDPTMDPTLDPTEDPTINPITIMDPTIEPTQDPTINPAPRSLVFINGQFSATSITPSVASINASLLAPSVFFLKFVL